MLRAFPAASSSATAIARVIAVEPKVILLNEPCSAPRPHRHRPHRGAEAGTSKTRYTQVIVTHNVQQASRVSDYTAFLGELIEYSPTERIFINPMKEQIEDYTTRAVRVGRSKSGQG